MSASGMGGGGAADGAAAEGLALRVPGKRVPAGTGWDWVARGWRLFARAPLMWVISVVLLFIVAFATNLLPIVGSIVFQLIQAVIAGGFVAACRSLERGGDFELEHLLAGFQTRFGKLVALGALVLLGWVLIALVFAMFAGVAIFSAFMTGDAENVLAAAAASSLSLMLGVLVALALMVPLMAAYWFAPPLVMLHGMDPVAAMKASFGGAMRNFTPFLLYGLVMTVAALIAAIPFGLGFLVWIPVAITSTYAAYRDIFTHEPPAAAPVEV